jgi:phage gpG-like protein
MRLTADVDTEDAEKMLDKISDRSRDFSPVWRYAKRQLEKSFSENFLSGGGLVGGWAPLDAGYASWKSTRRPAAPILVFGGQLFNSLRSLDRTSVNKIDKLSAEFGTDIEYAKFHQYGTTKMPQRKIIFEPKGFTNDLSRKARNYVIRGKI